MKTIAQQQALRDARLHPKLAVLEDSRLRSAYRARASIFLGKFIDSYVKHTNPPRSRPATCHAVSISASRKGLSRGAITSMSRWEVDVATQRRLRRKAGMDAPTGHMLVHSPTPPPTRRLPHPTTCSVNKHKPPSLVQLDVFVFHASLTTNVLTVLLHHVYVYKYTTCMCTSTPRVCVQVHHVYVYKYTTCMCTSTPRVCVPGGCVPSVKVRE